MSIKSFFIQQYASRISRNTKAKALIALEDQNKWFYSLINKAKKTDFGKDHDFSQIKNHEDFVRNVPIVGYEELKKYTEKVIEGHSNVLWPGIPKYLAKTSGTTSGTKYIPITPDSMSNHMNGARDAIFNYTTESGKSNVYNDKIMFLSGSPVLDTSGSIPTGRLSGIANHEVPSYLTRNQLPSKKTNCIEDWEEKVNKIVEETHKANLSIIGGIPPWVQMYFEKLLEYTGKKTVLEVFPNLVCFVYGGVNYKPYESKINELIGAKIDSIELFPASEGFFAYQDRQGHKDMLLQTDAGIFYEFVPLEEIFEEKPSRLQLKDVEIGKDYALIINSNAGLWGYNIGDTVRFTSLLPYRVIVSGRIKHFISAFGEHVIATEVETALQTVAKKYNLSTNEFTVAPQVNPMDAKLPYHEWFIAFDKLPQNLAKIASEIDLEMQKQNIYYRDLIDGKILETLKLRPLKSSAFREYMQSIGKLGGQNKVPRLSNDRKIADQLNKYIINQS